MKVACKPPLNGSATFVLEISEGAPFLKNEVERCLQFERKNFIEILGVESKDGLNVIAMEQGDGNLYSKFTRGPPNIPRVAVFEDLVTQIGRCLVELSKGTAHLNIKPANIIVFPRPLHDQGFIFKLSDLGFRHYLPEERNQ